MTATSDSIKYVCPDCKRDLRALSCVTCGTYFSAAEGIPNLLSRAPRYETAHQISSTYDSIYRNHRNAWEDQGRPPAFIEYFAALVDTLPGSRLLELGCGEGILLEALSAESKAAIDISALALQKAQNRTGADCAVAIAERLPFPDGSFDKVVSVGVMEHFLNQDAAMTETFRVLRRGGYAVTLLHLAMTPLQEIQQKVREYLFPVPHPVSLTRWLVKKIFSPIHQPVQLRFTLTSSRSCMERNGLVVERCIRAKDRPRPPLGGPHVVIFVARKPRSGLEPSEAAA